MSDPDEIRRQAILEFLRICESHAVAGRLAELRDEVATNPLLGFTENRLDKMLDAAIDCKSPQLVVAMLELGAAINRENDGFPPIIIAIDQSRDDPAMVELLLDHGADVQARGMNDFTPLHRAACWGFRRVVELLLDRGAKINARTRIDDYSTPMIEAARAGQLAVVELLLDRGADPTEFDGQGANDTDARSESREQQIDRLLMRYRHALGIRKPKLPQVAMEVVVRSTLRAEFPQPASVG